MAQKLSDYLTSIGLEETGIIDSDGTIKVLTNDELLAREVWKRALGYEAVTKNGDGVETHRIFAPCPKAQAFIFERREGKVVTPTEETSITLVEKLDELIKSQVNAEAEKIVEEPDDSPS